jgi:tetratricopeptide (TPR) repeat protein
MHTEEKMSGELSKTDLCNRNTALMNLCASSLTVFSVVLANWSTVTSTFNNLTTLITAETYLFAGEMAGEDKKGAIEYYTKAIQLKPDNANAYYYRGHSLSSIGDKKGAIDDYNQAIAIYRKEGKTVELADALDRVKELSK